MAIAIETKLVHYFCGDWDTVMSFIDNEAIPYAFWVAETGGWKALEPAEAAALPVDGRWELSFLPIRHCRDVLVAVGKEQTTLFWDARCARRSTIDRAMENIQRLGAATKLRFHTYIDAWLTTDLSGFQQALKQLDWFDRRSNVLHLPRTNIAEKSVADMYEESPFLSSAFGAWHRATMEQSPNELFSISDDSLLYELLETGGPMELVNPGRRHPISLVYGDHWRRSSLTMAQRQKSMDTLYENRVTDVYDDVIASNEPRYDHIHAFIRVNNGLPRWARYRRLLLPWSNGGSVKAIYCLAEQSNHIDIPFMQAA